MTPKEIVIENMLRNGRDPLYIHLRLDVPKHRIRRFARRRNLPLNRRIRVGGRLHRSIVSSMQVATAKEVGTLFRQTPERIIQACNTPYHPKPHPPEYI